ncbi:coatomer WD associated region-domain-containing protein [Cantharellus anzutake]|uniref:coatomer WD associated region-domain-containing protein n=1 Tax=Cantharellus anzutake TaxID=1750568 RepID=UPI001904A591|nr:coatomer WD associated region-domain-containing protein [Cantharellus anzutake]KAF8343107.1 coatomer WD associated region-domain-containing protein [Cantharellus anzutake]
MLTKFESKSNRVKGLAFHPARPLLAASLHNGSVQLWNYQMGTLVDRFEEHDGPVRGVAFHPTRPLLVTGGDDYKIKVWDIRPQNRRCLFTLHGHMDYVRTVQFHHEMPWILSASDDQTIRIWNSTSRTCITMLTGHSHYIMSAQFHPKEDLVVSASQDQTIRVWDISGLRKAGGPSSHQNNFDTFDTIGTVKYVLEGHDRGVNYATFHPTLPLIVSAGDDRQVKLWRMSETKAWEVDACRGHFNNVSMSLFHPRQELILSVGEDKTIRVWEMGKRTSVQTFRREHDRFWVLTAHPELNLFAAGHDSGLIVFKLERERPAFALYNDTLFYVRDKYVRQYDLNTKADYGVLSVRKLGNQWLQPRTLSYNPAERAVLVTSSTDSAIYELVGLPKEVGSEVKDSTSDGKRGNGSSVVFVARNRFAVLEKAAQSIAVRDLSNSTTKTVKPPVQTNEIFYGGTGCLFLSSPTAVVLYELQQQKTLAEVSSPPVKYVVWNNDGNMVALLSKHTITIANKTLSQSCLIHETIRIKSGAWDDTGAFIYSTLNHIKFCLPNGDNGIIRTLEQPLYLVRVKGRIVHCLDRSARPQQLTIDPTEYRFKLALIRRNYEEVLNIIRTSNLVGQGIIAYLQKKGYPEIALHFVQDKNTRFDLAIECGNLEVALETADSIDRPEIWNRLAQQALRQGNHKIVEKAYQRTKNFDKLSFLYLAIGSLDKLAKMQKIADMRGHPMSKFHTALYAGDVLGRVKVLRDVGLYPLAYLTARTNGLDEVAAEVLQITGLTETDIEDLPSFGRSSLGPPKVITSTAQRNWPAISLSESVFEKALVSGALEAPTNPEPYINGHVDGSSAGLGEWEGGGALTGEDGVDDGWALDEVATPDDQTNGHLEDELKGEAASAQPGVSETELWVRNSPYAGDHIAAGSFESAMKLLNRQYGVVEFGPLKPLFLAGYRSAHAYISLNPVLPPLPLHIRRNPEESSPSKALPIMLQSLQTIRSSDLLEAYKFVAANKLQDAAAAFRSILLSLLIVVPTSPSEVTQLNETVAIAREYLLGVSIELERRRLLEQEPTNVRRNLELAAYFTHCELQPPHLKLALRNAANVHTKAKNHATAAKFARRLLDLKPDAKIVAQARQMINEGDRNPIDVVETSYDTFTEFKICAASFTPILKGSPSAKDPFTGAIFQPEYKGRVSPLTGVTEIGIQATGLPTPR